MMKTGSLVAFGAMMVGVTCKDVLAETPCIDVMDIASSKTAPKDR